MKYKDFDTCLTISFLKNLSSLELVSLVQKVYRFLSTFHQSTIIQYLNSINSRFRCLINGSKLCLWLRIMAVVVENYFNRIRFHFRDAIWTDADQSGTDQSPFKVPVLCEQENCSSIGLWSKKHCYGTHWWNVVAGQKVGEVKHCSKMCPYKKTRKYAFCWLLVIDSCEICHYVCPSYTRGTYTITVMYMKQCHVQ